MPQASHRPSADVLAATRCAGCRRSLVGRLTGTGHLTGDSYRSQTHGMRYRVEEPATVWELAPDAAVVRRWENANVTVSSEPRAADEALCDRCAEDDDPAGAGFIDLGRVAGDD